MPALTDAQIHLLDQASSKLDYAVIDEVLRPLAKEFNDLLQALQQLGPRIGILRFLDNVCEGFSIDQLASIVRAIDVPSKFATKGQQFRQRLINEPDTRITNAMFEFIDSQARQETAAGTSLAAHQAVMANFRFVRWLPDDRGISDALQAAAQRPQPDVEARLVAYLADPPWGVDRRATSTLLQAMAENPCDAYRQAIGLAIDRYQTPAAFRGQLLGVLFLDKPIEATRIQVSDLRKPMPLDFQLNYLNQLSTWLAVEKKSARHPEMRATAIEEFKAIDTRTWTRLGRGILAEFYRQFLPECLAFSRASPLDRMLCFSVNAFTACRLDHMGCMVSGPICLAIAFGFPWLLSRIIAPPAAPVRFLDAVAIALFLSALFCTVTTHFTRETLSQRLKLSLFFWGSILMFPTMVIGIRVLRILSSHHP
jgi:hypothetical protein